jgi:hypothetical protein
MTDDVDEIMARWEVERAGKCGHPQPCQCREMVRQEITARLELSAPIPLSREEKIALHALRLLVEDGVIGPAAA